MIKITLVDDFTLVDGKTTILKKASPYTNVKQVSVYSPEIYVLRPSTILKLERRGMKQ